MPSQPGNSGFPEHQRRAKLFAEALRMEIAAAGDDHQALRRVARALLAEACNGNVAAASMIADRLDGKVPQPVGGSNELAPQRLHVSWRADPHRDTPALAPVVQEEDLRQPD
jgi:hypothetical protein